MNNVFLKMTSYLKGAFKPFDRSICYICHGDFKTGALCALCRRALPKMDPAYIVSRDRYGLDAVSVAYALTSPVKEMLLAWKENGHRVLDQSLLSLYPTLEYPDGTRLLLFLDADPVIRQRGEDPCLRLARRYARRLGIPLLTLPTWSEFGVERLKKGSFTMPTSLLIFEDVLSPSSSLLSISSSLRELGAKWIGLVAFARREP